MSMSGKKLSVIAVLVMFVSVISFPAVGSAATVTFSSDTTLLLPNGVSLTVLGGSLVESLVVNDNSSISLTFDTDTNITFRSYDVYVINSSTGGSQTCVPNGYNQVTITTTSGSGGVTVDNPTLGCNTLASGGNTGGGGGGGTPVVQQTTTPTPTSTSATITSSAGGSATMSNGAASVIFPTGAVTSDGTVTIEPQTSFISPGAALGVVGGTVYDFAFTVGGQTVSTFSQSVTLTFTYDNSDISGLDESTLGVYYFDTDTNQWIEVGGTINAATNTISVEVQHFTLFGVFGQPIVASGRLIKLACAANADINDPCKSVYYVGKNNKRFVFPNEKIYASWYSDFSQVEIVSAETMAAYQIGGNVTYRPGIRMIKIQSDPNVYAVDANGSLRWVVTEAVAQALYGSAWNTMVDDISAAFFFSYTIGADVADSATYNKETIRNAAVDINTNQVL